MYVLKVKTTNCARPASGHWTVWFLCFFWITTDLIFSSIVHKKVGFITYTKCRKLSSRSRKCDPKSSQLHLNSAAGEASSRCQQKWPLYWGCTFTITFTGNCRIRELRPHQKCPRLEWWVFMVHFDLQIRFLTLKILYTSKMGHSMIFWGGEGGHFSGRLYFCVQWG